MRTKKLLIDESPILVLPSLAEKIGLNEAIFLQQLNYWININLQNKENPTEWCYNTYAEWREQLPFWSESTIQRVVKNLKDKNLIVVDKRNKDRWNKTNYYTIDYDEVSKLEEFAGKQREVIDNGFREEDITTPPPKQPAEQKEKPKTRKKDKFTLSRLTSFENLSKQYQDDLKEYIAQSGKSEIMSYEEFRDGCIMKDYKYKNFKLAYGKWAKNAKPKSTSSTQPLSEADKKAIKMLEGMKENLPKVAIEKNKILCNMEEVNALRAWRDKNPTFYKELLGIGANGKIDLKDNAYVRHAIKEQGYAKKFLTFVNEYTGRYGEVK